MSTRRDFLGNVGKGMLTVSLGTVLMSDLSMGAVSADGEGTRLEFGPLERLAGQMEETPAEALQPLLLNHLQSGVPLGRLVAAGTLANARRFGGEDYMGYHALMAMAPAYQMAQEISGPLKPLPVFKVLHRNSGFLQQSNGRDTLHPITASTGRESDVSLREATRKADMALAEARFANLAQGDPKAAFDALQMAVQDDIEVHRVVLAHRAWSLLDLVGEAHAHTMLRETVRFCVSAEQRRIRRGQPEPAIRKVLPAVFDEYKLHARTPGMKRASDQRIERLSMDIYTFSRADAARAVGEALAEGLAVNDIGEAISLAANRLELCDRGQRVHGACAGVHASDSAHAYRGIAAVSDARNQFASMIVGAYHICKQGRYSAEPYPLQAHFAKIKATDPKTLLEQTANAIRNNDQKTACAAVSQYGRQGHNPEDVFAMLRDFAISEDGRLHGEKYYITVRESFAASRPAFRWSYLVGLTRASASAYGYSLDDEPGVRAPGYEQARKILKA